MNERRKDLGEGNEDLRSGFQSTDDPAEAGFIEGRSEFPGDDRVMPGQRRHASGDPQLSGGDVDAAWDRSDSGEETVGGSGATPDQDVVDEIGEAAGITYEDSEPLHTVDKVGERDRHRWEMNPASSEDFEERTRDEREGAP